MEYNVSDSKARLLRAKEVSALTGLSPAMAYKLMAAQVLPTVRMGRSVRVPLAALEAWIEANTVGGVR
jgi:excisionase family DNA binding protein